MIYHHYKTVLLLIFVQTTCFCCTEFRVIAKDKTVVIGRSMEWGQDLQTQVIVQPRGTERQSLAPDGSLGLQWQSKYGIVYMDGYGLDKALDGMNEKGLSASLLFFPGFAEYQTVPLEKNAKALSHTLFVFWILDNFETVEQVRKALPEVRVWGEPIDIPLEKNVVLPVHYGVYDATGKGIVIEYTKDGLKIFDNEIGVLTNSPTYDWHLINVRNYAGLTSAPGKGITIGSLTVPPIGLGIGLFGLPGDPTPPSRFIRTATALRLADTASNTQEAVNLTNHILNMVDITLGLVIKDTGTALVKDYTQWVVLKDLTNRDFYFRTYKNAILRKIDLKKLDFNGQAKKHAYKVDDDVPSCIDITGKLKDGVAKATKN